MPLPLQTQRLTLRSPRVEDAKALLEVFGDADAMRYIGDGRTRTLEELCLALERGISLEAEHGFNMFVVVRREDGRVLGDCGLSVWQPTGETEVGWRFAKEHWRHGYAYEAAKAVLRFAAEEVGLTRVISVIHPENVASKRLAERLGFAAEREEEVDGIPVVYYARPLVPLNPPSAELRSNP
jgi:RimJ/RimL family protein N-acetyltransferase